MFWIGMVNRLFLHSKMPRRPLFSTKSSFPHIPFRSQSLLTLILYQVKSWYHIDLPSLNFSSLFLKINKHLEVLVKLLNYPPFLQYFIQHFIKNGLWHESENSANCCYINFVSIKFSKWVRISLDKFGLLWVMHTSSGLKFSLPHKIRIFHVSRGKPAKPFDDDMYHQDRSAFSMQVSIWYYMPGTTIPSCSVPSRLSLITTRYLLHLLAPSPWRSFDSIGRVVAFFPTESIRWHATSTGFQQGEQRVSPYEFCLRSFFAKWCFRKVQLI